MFVRPLSAGFVAVSEVIGWGKLPVLFFKLKGEILWVVVMISHDDVEGRLANNLLNSANIDFFN